MNKSGLYIINLHKRPCKCGKMSLNKYWPAHSIECKVIQSLSLYTWQGTSDICMSPVMWPSASPHLS